jgi:hypothetical protein
VPTAESAAESASERAKSSNWAAPAAADASISAASEATCPSGERWAPPSHSAGSASEKHRGEVAEHEVELAAAGHVPVVRHGEVVEVAGGADLVFPGGVAAAPADIFADHEGVAAGQLVDERPDARRIGGAGAGGSGAAADVEAEFHAGTSRSPSASRPAVSVSQVISVASTRSQ